MGAKEFLFYYFLSTSDNTINIFNLIQNRHAVCKSMAELSRFSYIYKKLNGSHEGGRTKKPQIQLHPPKREALES